MTMMQTRRQFLTTLSLAGAAGLARAPRALGVEGPLETTSIRLFKYPGICVAPQHIAEELLRAEGFTVPEDPARRSEALARAKVDFGMDFGTNYISAIDRGAGVALLSGVHVGCFELRARAGIRGMADLKGKNVGVRGLGESEHLFLAVMAAQVGIDPGKDVHWVTGESVSLVEAIRGRKDRCVPRISARVAGPARPTDRERRGQQCHRSPVVAIFLLHVSRQ
jgi:NitT/TauT family transport system substrate-binding protein